MTLPRIHLQGIQEKDMKFMRRQIKVIDIYSKYCEIKKTGIRDHKEKTDMICKEYDL